MNDDKALYDMLTLFRRIIFTVVLRRRRWAKMVTSLSIGSFVQKHPLIEEMARQWLNS